MRAPGYFDKEETTEVEKRQNKVLEDLKIKTELQTKLQQRQRDFEDREKDARDRAALAKTRADGVAEALTRAEGRFWARLKEMTRLSGDTEGVLGHLGLREETIRSGPELHRAWEEARSLGGRFQAHWRFIREKPDFLRILLWAGLAACLLPAAHYVAERFAWTQIPARITQLAALVRSGTPSVRLARDPGGLAGNAALPDDLQGSRKRESHRGCARGDGSPVTLYPLESRP